MASIKWIAIILILLPGLSHVRCEPWLSTDDPWLRADVEMLSEAGVIQSPITTYPLMWSRVVKAIDKVDIEQVPWQYKAAYWRLKKAAKKALRGEASQLTVSVANGEQVLRSFGDNARSEFELSAKRSGVGKYTAWNLEVTRTGNTQDGENTRLDGSYFSLVTGNWITTLGRVEKWWGPTWQSANLLSNNARPPLGVSIQRNYASQAEVPLFAWLGPWSFNAFIAKLDDDRVVQDANLAGFALTFKPLSSLELGIRTTALWGGQKADEAARPDSFGALLETFLGREECDLLPQELCGEENGGQYYSAQGDRMAGVDFRWQLPVDYPVALYGSVYGEDETSGFPSKNINQLGLSSSFSFLDSQWKTFLEVSDTTLGKDEFNQAYESPIYESGYRYYYRAIGSTYDNDSRSISIGVLGSLNRVSQLKLVMSQIDLNRDGENRSEVALHSIGSASTSVNQLEIDWAMQLDDYSKIKVSLDYYDSLFDQYERLNDKYRLNLDWIYSLN